VTSSDIKKQLQRFREQVEAAASEFRWRLLPGAERWTSRWPGRWSPWFSRAWVCH